MSDQLLDDIEQKMNAFLNNCTDEEFWQMLEEAGLEVYSKSTENVFTEEENNE